MDPLLNQFSNVSELMKKMRNLEQVESVRLVLMIPLSRFIVE